MDGLLQYSSSEESALKWKVAKNDKVRMTSALLDVQIKILELVAVIVDVSPIRVSDDRRAGSDDEI